MTTLLQPDGTPTRTTRVLESIHNLTPLKNTSQAPSKDPFAAIDRPRVFFPPSPPQNKRPRSPSPRPAGPRAQCFRKQRLLVSSKGNSELFVPIIKRRLVDKNGDKSPSIVEEPAKVSRNAGTKHRATGESITPSDISDEAQKKKLGPKIVRTKILLKYISLSQPVEPKPVVIRSPKNITLVDSMLEDLPSDAAKYPDYDIAWLRAGGFGGQSQTYVVQLLSEREDKLGPLIFAKRVHKDVRDCTEMRAYERLASASSGLDEKEKESHFILFLSALVDHPELPHWFFLFDVCIGDLLLATGSINDRYCVGEHLQLWLAQIAAGLNYLHGIGIIHRDIKAENVLIDWQLNLRLTDLGLAYTSERRQRLKSNVNYAHRYVGTRGLMAPEVAKIKNMVRGPAYANDLEELDRHLAIYGLKADYWSLGLLFYEIASFKSRRLILSRSNMTKLLKLRRQWLSRGISLPLHSFFAEDSIEPQVGELICHLLDPSPTTRADFETLYSHEYFYDSVSDGPLFDCLYDISVTRPILEIPERYYKKTLEVDIHHVTHMVGHHKTSWINPKAEAFRFLDTES